MKPLRVLLVDDEEELVVTLVERLEFRGIEADSATSGQEALACLKNGEYDVVVADLKMPGIDGLELKSVVEKAHLGTEVVLFTGHGGSGAEEESEADVLMKPFSIEALVERIREAARRREVASGGVSEDPVT